MSEAARHSWLAANQHALVWELARVRRALARHAGEAAAAFAEDVGEPAPEWPEELPPPALDRLGALFGLGAFERDVLLLCAGAELETAFAPLCAAAQADPRRDYPTFGLALAALPGPDWAALAPGAPLRRWQLVQPDPGHGLTRAALRIDERVLHELAGVGQLDERLDGIVRPLPELGAPTNGEELAARELAGALAEQFRAGEQPAAMLTGPRRSGRRAVAAGACDQLGLQLYVLDSGALPAGPAELERLLRLWQREAALAEAALLLEYEADGDPAREAIVARFVDRAPGVLIVSSAERRGRWERALVVHELGRPAPAERRGVWATALGPAAAALNGQLDRVAAQFDLEPAAVGAAWAAARGRLAVLDRLPDSNQIGAALWDASREQARPKLDDLAQRIEPGAGWDELVLPEAQRELLREIALQVRNRAQVYESWGFGARGTRGLGVTALFAGASGTGKTMAAEVLAGELRLDLYRVDLSQVVSKYIGETEKNLRRVFDAAEGCGAILLFDEADALFGKRSDVKDSHDRHANVEVSYLLQRMEAYGGLAILTTNLKDSLDSAFLRRIRFVVQFPFPDAAQRAAIWRRAFPAAAPVADLDADKLARLNVAGGNIRNIALHAAFLAADAGEPVGMRHLLRAARREYAKLERALTDAETKGWV
jgi:hypothetical protein